MGPSQDAIREDVLWGNLMAGGGGVEYYFGYSHPQSDLTCEDWTARDRMWDYTRYALEFFQNHIPFQDMYHNDGLVSTGYCLAKKQREREKEIHFHPLRKEYRQVLS